MLLTNLTLLFYNSCNYNYIFQSKNKGVNMIGKILKTIKTTIFKDKLDDLYQQEFNFGTEADLNHPNPITKEINYTFDGYIGDSQAFLTYNMAYEKLYDVYYLKNKTSNQHDNNKPNHKEGLQKIFELSQSAFALGISTFNYSVINGNLDKTYIHNLIRNKMREFKLDFGNLEKHKNEKIKVQIEALTFFDNSMILRITFSEIETSMLYGMMLQNNKDDFKEFIQQSHKLSKNRIDSFVNDDFKLDTKSIQKMKDVIGEDQLNQMLQDMNQNKGVPLDEKTANEIFEYQAKQTLDYVDFGYISTYNMLIENFNHGVLIDITDIETLFKYLDVKTVKKFYSLDKFKNNNINKKIRQDIKTPSDFVKFLSINNMLIKLEKKA